MYALKAKCCSGRRMKVKFIDLILQKAEKCGSVIGGNTSLLAFKNFL